MGFISELSDTIKGIIGTIIGVGIVLELLMPGVAASILILVGFLMLLFSGRRGLGFLLMVFAFLWLYLVDYSIIIKFYDGIGLINIDNMVAGARLGEKTYKADYIHTAYTLSDHRKSTFNQNEEINLAIGFDKSKGYIYNRSYPEKNLILYRLHKSKKKKEDPYAPKIPLEDKVGFVYPNDGGYGVNIPKDITFAENYTYLGLPRTAEKGYVNVWRIKEANKYLKPGKWEVYVFMGLPNTSTPFHKRDIIQRTSVAEDFLTMNMPKPRYKNIKRYWNDELAVKLSFKIK